MTSKDIIEECNEMLATLGIGNYDWYESIKSRIEVLELLKTRQVELKLIKASKDYKHYLNLICSYNVFTDLTEEEYNLIKEWLEK